MSLEVAAMYAAASLKAFHSGQCKLNRQKRENLCEARTRRNEKRRNQGLCC